MGWASNPMQREMVLGRCVSDSQRDRAGSEGSPAHTQCPSPGITCACPELGILLAPSLLAPGCLGIQTTAADIRQTCVTETWAFSRLCDGHQGDAGYKDECTKSSPASKSFCSLGPCSFTSKHSLKHLRCQALCWALQVTIGVGHVNKR